jgi:hypothetical protein
MDGGETLDYINEGLEKKEGEERVAELLSDSA